MALPVRCSASLVQVTLDISVFYNVKHLDQMTTATCSCEVLLAFFAVLAGNEHIHTLGVVYLELTKACPKIISVVECLLFWCNTS